MDKGIRIGQVYWIDFPGGEHVQAGTRPGIIWQNNVGNHNSPNVIAIPLTSKLKKVNLPTHVVLDEYASTCNIKSMAVCEGKQSVCQNAVGNYIATLTGADLERIAIADLLTSGSLCFIDATKIRQLTEMSARLNTRKEF